MGNIVWNTSELESIKKQTLGNLRPLYYSMTNKKYLQISDDFEGFLILQSADEKRKILNWISDITKINNGFTDYKYPKLSELYNHLFKEQMQGAHNAEDDVINCAKCYFKMV